MVANRLSIDGKVYNTEFVGNRAARVAEEISREMGLTIANEVRRQKEYRKAQVDPVREAVKKELQTIAYGELGRKHPSTKEFLFALIEYGVGPKYVKNKQGKVYGLRFEYKGQTFKASEIGREFGFRSLFNQHGQRLKGQKGQSKVPRYEPPKSGHYTAPEQSRTRRESQRVTTTEEPKPQRSLQGIIDAIFSAVQAGGVSEDEFNNELEEQKRKKKKYGLKP